MIQFDAVLQWVAVCNIVLQCVASPFLPPLFFLPLSGDFRDPYVSHSFCARECVMLQYDAIRCCVLQWVVVCSIVLQCVVVCCNFPGMEFFLHD